MRGLMMDYQLTVSAILRRVETLFGEKEIVSCLPDKNIHRYTYRDFALRTKKLALALHGLGVREGDRVATLCWNHYQHLETYFALPCTGAIIHPLNLRFSPEDLSYIINEAEDKILIVDQVLLPVFEKFKSSIKVSHVIVIRQTQEPLPEEYLNYEDVLQSGDDTLYKAFEGDEYAAAFMCYTSGTTGKPKGVLYSHRSILLHAMSSLMNCCGIGITEQDVVLPIVPMFHAGAWGLPYNCALVGATQVFAGPSLDAESLLQLLQSEKVTLTGAVPTVILGILHLLDDDPDKYKLFLRTIMIGGSAMPRVLIKSFDERYGIKVLHTWGMTEISPLGVSSVITSKLQKASKEEQYDHATKQGMPIPLVEIRGRNEQGFIPWDGNTMGELEVRGPWVASAYYRDTTSGEKFTADGWLKTGDIVTIDEDGFIEIKDRSKDLIKSGGEWISSVALEVALVDHPAVLEAAVIGVPDVKWMERPFAYVVPKPGKTVSPDELREFLTGRFPKFWIPEGYAMINAIPKTSVGKFLKSALREKYNRDLAESAGRK
jgi:fatty-acyl-CoA synthase